MEIGLEEGKSGGQETSLEAVVVIHMRNNDRLRGREDVEKWR